MDKGDNFYPGHRQCKDCFEESQRRRAKERPLIRYWIRIKHLYGLTKDGFQSLRDSQKGLCRVCSVVLDKPDVDHCHRCDEVRGLLCHRCNILCGIIEKNRGLIPSVIEYLDGHKHSI